MPKPEFEVLPSAFIAWRKERKLTQRQLAHNAEVTPATIGRIEIGDLKPSWFTLVAIANALGVAPDALALIRTRPIVEAVA